MPARKTLSEFESMRRLAATGIPVAAERLCASAALAESAAVELGFPVAVKLCGDAIAHKTERGLVRLGLRDAAAARAAALELLAAARPEDGPIGILVARMVAGKRELIAGCATDPTFGLPPRPVTTSAKSCASTALTGSLSFTVQETFLAVVGDGSLRRIDTAWGGTESTVQVQVAAALVLPSVSAAVTEKVCGPCARPL